MALLTNSKPLILLLQHLPNKEIAGVPVSGATLISLTIYKKKNFHALKKRTSRNGPGKKYRGK